MRCVVIWTVLVPIVLGVVAVWAPCAVAATKSEGKAFGEPNDEQALVYLIREKRLQGSARTMFVYADDAFLGTLENNSFTFAYLEPGPHLLWLNWAKLNKEIELEAGRTYYFNMWIRIEDLGEEWGKGLITKVKFYCEPEEKELATAEEHVEKRYSKAQRTAARKTDYVGRKKRREDHIADWPQVDLSQYSALGIEEFELTDPKANERGKHLQVKTAPERLAKRVEEHVGAELFAQVIRGPVDGPVEDMLILEVEITQYKPGSRAARGLIAGAGSAHLDFTGRLIDSQTGEELSTFSGKRTWAWGGVVGESFGIEEIERNVAFEIALYLQRCTGRGGP